MPLEVDRWVWSRLNESRGSVCIEKEMLKEGVCALKIPEKDMRAAEEWEDEVGAMKMRLGNVEAVKMCGGAVGAAQMRGKERHEDEMWEQIWEKQGIMEMKTTQTTGTQISRGCR